MRERSNQSPGLARDFYQYDDDNGELSNDRFKEDEILDLVAYVLSGGDAKHAMFRKN